MAKFLVVGDVDQIQSYVFGSSRLRAIRGASALLECLIAQFVRQQERAGSVKFLRWKGGQVVAVIEAPTSETVAVFCAELENTFRRKSGQEATITTSFAPYDFKFRHTLGQVFTRIRREKDGRQDAANGADALLCSPFYHRCNQIPSLYAEDFESVINRRDEDCEDNERGDTYLSAAAKLRRDVEFKTSESDEELRNAFMAVGFGQSRSSDRLHFSFPYAPEHLFGNASTRRRDRPNLVETTEGGYMAFIAADGNSIGQMLEVIPDEDLYREFSVALREAFQEAIAEAAKEVGMANPKCWTNWKRRRFVPLVPVITAGDDLSLLVRAGDAPEFTRRLAQALRERTKRNADIQRVIQIFCTTPDFEPAARQLFPERFYGADGSVQSGLTLSAGIAIARHKFPISSFRRLAFELRDSAKARLRRSSNERPTEGAVDFAFITTAAVRPLEKLREDYTIPGSHHLTRRAYRESDFGNLLELARSLAKLPRSKRKFLYAEMFRDKASAEAAFDFVMSRAVRSEKERIKMALSHFNPNSTAFHKGSGNLDETPLVDALELAEILELNRSRK